MIETLTLLLRFAGSGLILLAASHIPIGRHLKWGEDAKSLSPVNQSVFHVHTIFICVVLVMMGLPCLLEPRVFLDASRAGSWLAWSFAAFWGLRLYFQWFVYKTDLWSGKQLETAVHWCFTFIWTGLAALFALCGMWQAGWIIR